MAPTQPAASPVDQLARSAYVARQLLARRAVLAVQQAWAGINPDAIRASWSSNVGPSVLATVTGAQYEAAAAANQTIVDLLSVQGVAATGPVVNPAAFAGVASDGRDLLSLLELANVVALRRIAAREPVDQALAVAGRWLQMVAGTQVVDAGRVADGVAIAGRREVTGYVRMLNPPSCEGCVVLAGKWFRWNEGFERHPRCDCRHIPVAEDQSDDLRTDPRAYFDSLTPAEQDRTFTAAGAQAIRAGADIGQVVNARQGMAVAGVGDRAVRVTTVGKRYRRGGIRPMPEELYRFAGGDRAEAVRLLRRFGYIV